MCQITSARYSYPIKTVSKEEVFYILEILERNFNLAEKMFSLLPQYKLTSSNTTSFIFMMVLENADPHISHFDFRTRMVTIAM